MYWVVQVANICTILRVYYVGEGGTVRREVQEQAQRSACGIVLPIIFCFHSWNQYQLFSFVSFWTFHNEALYLLGLVLKSYYMMYAVL